LGHLKLLNGDFDLVRDLAEPRPPSVALFVLSTLDVPEPLLPDMPDLMLVLSALSPSDLSVWCLTGVAFSISSCLFLDSSSSFLRFSSFNSNVVYLS
jgi:hypothetical protein